MLALLALMLPQYHSETHHGPARHDTENDGHAARMESELSLQLAVWQTSPQPNYKPNERCSSETTAAADQHGGGVATATTTAATAAATVEWRLRVDAARMGSNMHASSLRRTGTSSDGWLSRNTLSRKYGNSGKGWPTDRDGLMRTESSIWDGRMNEDERRMNQA